MKTREFNFDGIVGPTHNYAGLSYGNVASSTHKSKTSHPKAAALQGLAKMKFVRDLGIGQCVLPPLLRPNVRLLRELGCHAKPGMDQSVIERAVELMPQLLPSAYSASNMWTANAATVSPSMDCNDDRLHLTPANLTSKLHRSIEAVETTRNLRAIFPVGADLFVHDPLPSALAMSDEGAANFMRICPRHESEGIEIFVWGRSDFGGTNFGFGETTFPKRFPARQTLESFQSIAQRHGVKQDLRMFIQQNPDAIDAGVFHNDVISVANENVLLAHELAFAHGKQARKMIEDAYETKFGSPFYYIEFSSAELSLEDTVNSYLFNSQLVTRGDGGMTLVCPEDVRENPAARKCTERMLSETNPIDSVEFLDLRQSMNNGGGPACLRLRVVLTPAQQEAMHSGVVLTDELYEKLVKHVNEYYRDDLNPDDLADPKLLVESRAAHENLMGLLGLDSV